MENKEKIPAEQSVPRITKEELGKLDIKTVKNIQDLFGVSYEGLGKLSKREVEILIQDATAITE